LNQDHLEMRKPVTHSSTKFVFPGLHWRLDLTNISASTVKIKWWVWAMLSVRKNNGSLSSRM